MKIIAALFLTAAAAVPALAADAPPAAANDRVCLNRHFIDSWGARDKHSMVITDKFGRKYLLSLSGLCDDLEFSFAAGIRPIGFGGDWCVSRGDHIVMRGGGAPIWQNTCWVAKVQTYSPDMAAADKAAREAHTPLPVY